MVGVWVGRGVCVGVTGVLVGVDVALGNGVNVTAGSEVDEAPQAMDCANKTRNNNRRRQLLVLGGKSLCYFHFLLLACMLIW